MGNVRVSSYLNQVDIGDGSSLLYNGSSLCIDLVPNDYAKRLAGGDDLSFLAPEEKEHLLKRGHLTTLTANNELKEFRKTVRYILEQRNRLDQSSKAATLCMLLTYDCNLSCSYCFQKSLPDTAKTPVMDGEFIDRFFAEYYPQLYPNAPEELLITLFGGEPLLPKNREAITRILAYAEQHPSVRVSVTTNATTIPVMMDLIGAAKGKIGSVHVTLDGDRILHDENRIPNSGKPTFDAMIASIKQLIALDAHVSLRMHIHPDRLESAKNLAEYLDAEKLLGHSQVSVYFSPINTFGSEQVSLAEAELFSQTFQQVAKITKCPPSNLLFIDNFLKMQDKKLLPKVRYCAAGSDHFHIVDPLGDLYSCYEDTGHKDRRIGSFVNGKVKFSALKDKYAGRHLLKLPECIRCSAALYCGGGCPSEARLRKGSMFTAYCHQNKEFIAQTMKAFFLLARETGASSK